MTDFTKKTVVLACSLFLLGFAWAEEKGGTDLSALLDSSRADLDGDGSASEAEALTFQQLLRVGIQPQLLVDLVQSYMAAPVDGIVDLSSVLGRSVDSAGDGSSSALGGVAEGGRSACPLFYRGDANGDGWVNGADPTYITNYLFLGGPAPSPMDAADGDDNGVIDVTDAIYLNSFLFLGGPQPPPPYPTAGLDPTPDDLDPLCDLHPQNYAEFNTFFAELDVTGDDVKDPLYVVPPNGIEIDPLDSTLEPVEFATLASGVVITKIAAANPGVVYVLTSGTSVYGLRDEDGDGVADVEKSFQVPSVPLDAVLVDTPDGQGLVTLHDNSGIDVLYLWQDNDDDDFFDALEQTVLTGGHVIYPKGLAVDATTARIFVSGEDYYGNSVILFYRDADGDKLVDAASTSPPYIQELNVRGDLGVDDLEFLGLHFVAEARKLLILTDEILPEADNRLVACAQDSYDLYTVPESVGVFHDPLVEEANAIYASELESGAVTAWVTLGDWIVQELEDENSDCVAESQLLISLPGASERAADESGFIICTVVFDAAVHAARMKFVLDHVDGECQHPQPGQGCSYHKENNQGWTVYAEKTSALCPDNGDGLARAELGAGGQPAQAKVLWSDGSKTRPTQIRARAVHRWKSGPDLNQCCDKNPDRSTNYVYEAQVNYGGAPGPAWTLHRDGGTFHEDWTDCWWEGKPQGVKVDWDPVGGAQVPWKKQAPDVVFNVSVSPQTNDLFRTSGGKSVKETAYQSVQVSIQCRRKPLRP